MEGGDLSYERDTDASANNRGRFGGPELHWPFLNWLTISFLHQLPLLLRKGGGRNRIPIPPTIPELTAPSSTKYNAIHAYWPDSGGLGLELVSNRLGLLWSPPVYPSLALHPSFSCPPDLSTLNFAACWMGQTNPCGGKNQKEGGERKEKGSYSNGTWRPSHPHPRPEPEILKCQYRRRPWARRPELPAPPPLTPSATKARGEGQNVGPFYHV